MSHRTIIILVALILTASVLAGFFTRPPKARAPSSVNEALDGSIDRQQNINARTITNSTDPLSVELRAVAKTRDIKRLTDIRNIRQALDQYMSENNGQYPDELATLAPTLIASVPNDPKTHKPYAYTLIGSGGDFYDLTYVLEMGVENIAAGEYTVTPDSLIGAE